MTRVLLAALLAGTFLLPAAEPETRKRFPVEGVEEYRELDVSGPFRIVPGSALDLSFLQDAPAGKYGRLVVRDGHFEFRNRPGVPVRLYGTNLCFDTQYLPKEKAAALADELARMGYNAVRIHHYDAILTSGGERSTDLNSEKLDQLDYLAGCLKDRGLYIAIDFYCSRKLRPGDIPEQPELGDRSIKMLDAVYDSALDNWKTFVRNLLNHRNPYTGLTWGEDPVLAIASLVNEDPLYTGWSRNEKIRAAFEERFAEYFRRRNITPATGEELLHQQAEILTALQNACYDRMRSFLREELGCEVLVTGVNYKNAEAQSFIREKLDYVDNHSYFNHPSFPGKSYEYPVKFRSKSPLALRVPEIRDAAHSRIFGKPFTITETNYVYPNRFRAVGGAILGGFGGYQDYDGIFRFAWSHKAYKLENPTGISYFDIVQDPVNLLSERIGILLFLRRELRPSGKKFVWLYDDSAFRAFKNFGGEAGRFPGSFNELALLGQIGSLNRAGYAAFPKKDAKFFVSKHAEPLKGAAAWPDGGVLGKAFRNPELASDTGEMRLIPKANQLAVITPKSEVLAFEGTMRLSGKVMTVEGNGGFGVFFLSSIDGEKPIVGAKRLLLLHLTDVQNTGIVFEDAENTVLRNWGTLPLLLRHGRAEVALKLPGEYKLRALRPDGSVIREIPVNKENGTQLIALDNFANGCAMAYELEKIK